MLTPMQRILATLILATLARAEETLTIATFNCEFLTRPKVHMKFGEPFRLRRPRRQEWEQPGVRDAKFKEAARAVAKVIRAINADVIVLTEVGNKKDVAELRDAVTALGLNYPHLALSTFNDPDTFQHTAVLSRFPFKRVVGRIPGTSIYSTELDDPEQERETEVGKGLMVEFDAYGKAFTLFGLHLKSERGGHEADGMRIAQASIVRRQVIDAIARNKQVIVAGDLNDYPGQPAIRRLRGFDDIYEELIQTGRSFYWPDSRLAERWTFQYRGRRQLIDQILISPSLRDACVANPNPRKDKNRRAEEMGIVASTLDHQDEMASDHRPLLLRLRLK